MINDLDVNVFNFKKFGKELPKTQGLSPNSFFQVALQLAYYRSVTAPVILLLLLCSARGQIMGHVIFQFTLKLKPKTKVTFERL